jgi:hypothetical protein
MVSFAPDLTAVGTLLAINLFISGVDLEYPMGGALIAGNDGGGIYMRKSLVDCASQRLLRFLGWPEQDWWITCRLKC